uniref:Uncharacterized protein n=1 Tax=Trichogramma kaykai TaxID=54128 RepID=A0ABD2WKJ1_9HYME
MDRNDALTIIKFSFKHGLFKNSVNVDRYFYSHAHERFLKVAERLTLAPNLSLYDLTRLRPKEAEKLLTYSDYYKFTIEDDFNSLPTAHYVACVAHMCEIMWGKFYRVWIMDVFLVLKRYRLPILCCRAIIENLESEDLLKICLATEIDASEQNQNV